MKNIIEIIQALTVLVAALIAFAAYCFATPDQLSAEADWTISEEVAK